MKTSTRRILLGIALLLIIVTIIYLESNNSASPLTPDQIQTLETPSTTSTQSKTSSNPVAVELVDPEGYFNLPVNATTNTTTLHLQDYVGKQIILVDFWTYSCINCQRTIPHLNDLYEKYHNQGLLMVGVHAPEFDFEKDPQNVKRAIEKFQIKYPVVQDNDMHTWQAYQNRYWPHKYLIDLTGHIVYDHIGEGGYEETEAVIQDLLQQRATILGTNLTTTNVEHQPLPPEPTYNHPLTPEIYMGYAYSRNQFGNREGWQPQKSVNYSFPSSLTPDLFYLEGTWLNNKDNMILQSTSGRIGLRYSARAVNIVAGADSPVNLTVYKDGKEYKTLTIKNYDLYPLIDDQEYGTHELSIKVSQPGLMAFTFTFG